MDYTKLPRNLIYRERRSLVEFGVKSNHINSMIFKRMQELPMFRDMVDGDVCALRCFNNAYYICLLILNDDFPRLRIRLYVDLALDKDRWKYSYDAQALTMGIVYILLKACGIDEAFLQDLYTFFRRFGWDSNGARFSFYNMVDSVSLKSYTVYKSEFAPRIVEEGMQSKDFLKDFIALDSELITEYITTVCTHDQQRLLLIRKTIQLEKESYGFLDMRIVQGYHTLYKLQADLTGTPMPERLSCDDVNPWGGPKLSPSSSSPSSPPELQDSSRVTGLQKEVSELRTVKERQKVEIERLKAEIERLKAEIERLNTENQELRSRTPNDERSDCSDLLERIRDLETTIAIFQQRKDVMCKTKAKRGGMALGLTPEQSVIFGTALFDVLGVGFKNKKDMARPLNALFGWGTSSLSQKLCGYPDEEDALYVASIFGQFSSEFAKSISKEWDESVTPPWVDNESPQD